MATKTTRRIMHRPGTGRAIVAAAFPTAITLTTRPLVPLAPYIANKNRWNYPPSPAATFLTTSASPLDGEMIPMMSFPTTSHCG
jgi:hypothetical protein